MKPIGCLALLLAAGCANPPADLVAAEEAHRHAVIEAGVPTRHPSISPARSSSWRSFTMSSAATPTLPR